MNKLYMFLISILLISFSSAIYPGETQVYPNTLGSENLIWTITGNTSEILVLPIVKINITNITITIPSDMSPDSFNIVFLEETTNIVVQTITVSSGGGHSSSKKTIKFVNNTEYIEVPKIEYIENKTIQYVENKTVETQNITTNKVPRWAWLLIILGIVSFILLIIELIMDNRSNSSEIKENIQLQGGQEKNE